MVQRGCCRPTAIDADGTFITDNLPSSLKVGQIGGPAHLFTGREDRLQADERCRRTFAVAAAALVACAIFMFVDPRVPPIIIWDESRLAVNALEMNQRGWSLITTYGFAPDLWNTKPPLMIWLMNASISLFGPSELALRLPSMAAGLGTLAVVFVFVRRVTHSPGTATLAVILLATSVAFYGEHGARTADYDALLCFFTTAYLSLFYLAVHRRRPSWRLLMAAAALVAAAAMTKAIAGILPGAGVALYLLVSGRLRRVLANPRYIGMMLMALAPLALFYLQRERIEPGYLHAVWYNDVAGRYDDQLGLHQRPPWFYVRALFLDGMFSIGPFALLVLIGATGAKGQARQALTFALCCVVAELVLVSIPKTRLMQYMLPALPWLAIVCAIVIARWLPPILRQEDGTGLKRIRPMMACVLAIAISSVAVPGMRLRYELLPQRAFYPEASYGALLASLHDLGVRRVTVIEPGVGTEAYAPQLQFYSTLWNERGMAIERTKDGFQTASTGVLASCNPAWTKTLHSRGAEEIGAYGCVAMPSNLAGTSSLRLIEAFAQRPARELPL